MQGLRGRQRRSIVLFGVALTAGIIALFLGWSANAAGAATDAPPGCLTPTPIPIGTPSDRGTASPSPTPLPPTATPTPAAFNGRLLGDAPSAATITASPTPPPVCTPAPALPTWTAVAPSVTRPAASAASAPISAGSPVPVSAASTQPSPRTSATAPASAPVAPPASSSSAEPPSAAVGLPPSPPPGYAPPDGSSPSPARGANIANFVPTGGTPVVSAVRGQVAPVSAQNVPVPAGVSGVVRPAQPGVTFGPTGAAAPVVIPRAGHPATSMTVPFSLVAGMVSVLAGLWLRRSAGRFHALT